MEVTRRFHFETFGHNVYVIVTDDIQKTAKKLSKKYSFQNAVTERTAGFTIQTSPAPLSLVVLSNKRRGPVIAHEAFHVVWHLMEHIGAEHEEEIMAYCLDTVVDWIERTYEALDKAEKVWYNGKRDRNRRKVGSH